MSDFFLPIPMSATVDSALVAAFQKVMNQARQVMSWLPNLAAESSSIFYGGTPQFPRLNPDPGGLDSDQQQQWMQVYRAAAPISNMAIRGEMKAAAAEGERLAADTAFWSTVYRVTEDVATLGVAELWTKFWEAVDACKASRDATAASLQAAQDGLDALGANASPELIDNQYGLQTDLDGLISKVKTTISPLGKDVVQNAGLGSALVVAGIAGAVVVAITASVWAIAHELAAVQAQANDHAQAVWEEQTKFDEAQLAAGNIDQNEFAARRANTASQMKMVADSQGAGAVGSGLAKAGVGVALAVGALAVGYFLLKKKSAAAAPSTNPRRRRYR